MLAYLILCKYYYASNRKPQPARQRQPGLESTTACAAMNPQSHYLANRLWFQGKSHDLPLLPESMQALRKAQERPTALSLQPVQQNLHGSGDRGSYMDY